MKRVFFCLALMLPAAAGVLYLVRPQTPRRAVLVAIQPLGDVPLETTATAAKAVRDYYGFKVVVLRPVELPPAAYTRPRDRYRAEKLLRFLEGPAYGRFDKVVGLTEPDISATKGPIRDWGVFGLGSLGGRSCVVSTFRLNRRASRAKLLGRLAKVVNHELGHTLGLGHCPVPGCLMADAKGTIASVDREEGRLCPACAAKVKGTAVLR